jgi:hypothetical protein
MTATAAKERSPARMFRSVPLRYGSCRVKVSTCTELCGTAPVLPSLRWLPTGLALDGGDVLLARLRTVAYSPSARVRLGNAATGEGDPRNGSPYKKQQLRNPEGTEEQHRPHDQPEPRDPPG